MTKNTTGEPGLVLCFEIALKRGAPIDVGETGTGGVRRYVPIEGGTIGGPGLSGRVVSGGETLLVRADGVTSIEATYYVENADGWAACGLAKGYRTAAEGTRMTLLFEASQGGPLAHLAMTAFAAEEADDGRLTIYRIT